MMIRPSTARLGFTFLALTVLICGFAANVNADTLDLSHGDVKANATAVTPSIFRISVRSNLSEQKPIDSTFISPTFHPGDIGVRQSTVDGHTQLKTERGVLDFDPTRGQLSLLDANGSVLIPASTVADAVGDGAKPSLRIHVGWPADRAFDVYGSGNGEPGLVQHSAKSHVGNGSAVQPFFWTPAGFAMFAVGSDDNAPPTCDGKVADGSVNWDVAGKSADVYLIVAPTLTEATQSLMELTGRAPVPPRWAFGYLQSQWGWQNKAYIDDTLHQFLSRRLPVDAFIFDFEWYTANPDYSLPAAGKADFSDFGFNAKFFPHPADQILALHDAGVHFVGIRKPRLGNTETLKMIRASGWGLPPSVSGFDARGLMFANADARRWYAHQNEPLLRTGVDGWWDDEGETSYTQYYHWNQAQRQSLDAVRPHERLWTVNRAFSPGTARQGAAAWTGDINVDWATLRRTPTDLLDWSIAGMPYPCCDIGGFAGQTNAELLTRWMEAGTFFPVMRTHSTVMTTPHFPWLWGPDAEAAMKKALELRYRLVPMLYSLGHRAHKTGMPIMRPLMMQWPLDPKVAAMSDEWMVGDGLLAAPVLDKGGHRTLYLPDDAWYDFATGEQVAGKQTIDRDVPFDSVPVFVRAGTILPLGPIVQHTRDLPGGPLEVRIYPGRDGAFSLVEDDGHSTAYLNGATRTTSFKWIDASHTLSWKRTGNYAGPDCFKSMRINVVGADAKLMNEQAITAAGSVVLK